MLNIKNYKNLCFNILIFIIIGFGIFLRASLYLKQIHFWGDEQLLGEYFFDNNISRFLFSIANYLKIPPLWGILNQIFLNIFGHSYLTFRFISFISGISAIIAFFFLLKNLFKDKIAVLTGLSLFSFNPWLIYYSNEFKPYSFDVLVCILLLLSFKFICFKNISFRKIILYTLISVVAILFSLTAIFIIPALILAKCIEEKHFNPKILFIFAGFFTVCLYLYFIDNTCYEYMVHYWTKYSSGFLVPSFSSFNLLINNFLNYVFGVDSSSNLFFIKYFVLIGLLFFFLNKQKEAFIFLFIFLFALSASLFKLYPFGYRVSLYLIPVILILITKIIDFLNSTTYKSVNNCIFIAIVIINLINPPKIFSYIENISNLMEFSKQREIFYYYSKNILEKINNQDIIIAPVKLINAFRFCNKFLDKNKETNIIIYDCNAINKEEAERKLLKSTLDNYDHSSTIWISGLKSEDSWDISPDNINIVEDELKKHNLEYTKTDDGYLYTFKVNK